MAAMIFSAIALSVMRILPACFRSLEQQKRRATATFLATRAMDMALEELHRTHAVNEASKPVQVVSEIAGERISVTYNVAAKAEPLSELTPQLPNLRRIIVVVSYDDMGDRREVRFETRAVN